MAASSTLFRIATRSSRLAKWQAAAVASLLKERLHVESKYCYVTSAGDKDTMSQLASLGGVGIFVKEVEAFLLDGRADIAVHSLKDLPVIDERIPIAAFPMRADARDAFVPSSRMGRTNLVDLPENSVIATSSPRRETVIRGLRPDINIVGIRGNVETRLSKIDEGLADGTMLAVAGLDRLGIGRYYEPLRFEDCPPAAGQGILAVQARDKSISEMLMPLDDPKIREVAEAERVVLRELEGGCSTAIGVHISLEGKGYAVQERGGEMKKIVVTDSSAERIAEKLLSELRN